MDWQQAIDRNRRVLGRLLAGLVTMAGLAGEHLPFASDGRLWPARQGTAPDPQAVRHRPTLSRQLRRAVLQVLRPAESALRRLVVIAARGLSVPPPRPRPSPAMPILACPGGTGIVLPRGMCRLRSPAWLGATDTSGAFDALSATPSRIGFRLLDPPRRLVQAGRPAAAGVPRILVGGSGEAVARRFPPSPYDRIDAMRIVQRLDALGRALDDLPKLALRFARWRARRDAALERQRSAAPVPGRPMRPVRVWPLRAGRPPGFRRRSREEIQLVLRDIHGLALDALKPPDTS